MNKEIREILQQFQDGYTARELAKLDEFVALFHQKALSFYLNQMKELPDVD